MKKPEIPAKEKERIKALLACGVLDTAPESEFDDLTYLASVISGCPIALVSLVDDDRQWFKSRVGLEDQETPRSIAFCAHAIHSTEPLIVPDATKDSRFADNPLVTNKPYIRFYAGSPLVTSEGLALGTLCVIDKEPRQLSEVQIDSLGKLAKQAAMLLEKRRLNQSLQRLQSSPNQRGIHSDEQVSSVEHLSREISHEINNPLAIVQGFLTRLRKELKNPSEPSPKSSYYLDQIQNGSERISSIVKDLIRSTEVSSTRANQTISFKELMKSALEQIGDQHTKDVQIDKSNLEAAHLEACQIPCSRTDLAKAVSYVLINAFEAAQSSEAHEKFVRLNVNRPSEKYLTLLVQDSGQKPPVSIAEKMFLPFFTTKYRTPGRGMGLNLARGIFRSHGGTIQYLSELPETSFQITFPVIDSSTETK